MQRPKQTLPPRTTGKASLIITLLTAVLFLVGCGGSSNTPLVTGQTGTGATTTPGGGSSTASDITLNFDLAQAQATVPVGVTDFRFTGLNTSGATVYGPLTRPKAAQVTLQNVPTTVTDLRIEYLDGALIVGQSALELDLTGGQNIEVDVDNFTAVSLEQITVTPSTATVIVGQSRQFSASGAFSNGATENISGEVSWAVGTPGIATVSATGNATGSTGGQTTVTATLGTVSGSATLTVNADNPLTDVEVTGPRTTLGVGIELQLKAEAVLQDNTRTDVTADATWSSSNEAVATVDPNTGLVTGVAAGGPVSITATFEGESGTADLTILALTLESIEITPPTATTIVPLTQQFMATGTFTDGTETTTQDITDQVEWGSSDENIATIDAAGLATTISPGEVDITASFDTGTEVINEDAPAVLTVVEATIQSIEVTPVNVDQPKVALFYSTEFKAVATLTNGMTVDITDDPGTLWTSSDPNVAFLNFGSRFFSQNPGQTVILARNSDINSTPVTLEVINSNLIGIEVGPGPQMILRGGSAQYEAIATYQDLNGGPDLLLDVTRGQGTNWSVSSNLMSENVFVVDGFAWQDPFTPVPAQVMGTVTADFQGQVNSEDLILDPREVTSVEILGVSATDEARLGDLPAGYGRFYRALVAFDGGSPEPLPASMASSWSLTSNSGGSIFMNSNFNNGWTVIGSDGLPNQTETLSLLGTDLIITVDDGTNPLASLAADFARLPAHRVIATDGCRELQVTGTFQDGLSFELPFGAVSGSGASISSGPPAIDFRASVCGDSEDTNPQTITVVDISAGAAIPPVETTIENVLVLDASEIRVEPAEVSLAIGESQQLSVFIDYPNGEQNVDITELAFWFPAFPSVEVNSTGLVTAVGNTDFEVFVGPFLLSSGGGFPPVPFSTINVTP